MSMYLNFEPHSWYMNTAIKQNHPDTGLALWYGVTLSGMTGYLAEFEATTLKDLKQQIKEYHQRQAVRDAYNRARIGE